MTLENYKLYYEALKSEKIMRRRAK